MNIADNADQNLVPAGQPSQSETPEETKEREEQKKEKQEAEEKLAEYKTTQEQVSKNAPAQVASDQQQVSSLRQDIQLTQGSTSIDEDEQAEEPLTETGEVPRKDLPYVKRAEKIIREDRKDPYKEEKDEEKLQKEYMDKELNLDVDINDDKE
jgi:hypothetical protein